MMPIAPLMIEHRLIERMTRILKAELQKAKETEKLDFGFVTATVDFIRTYADKCHHGKEEDILFNQLEKKNLQPIHSKIMYELIKDHVWARKRTSSVVDTLEKLRTGDKKAYAEITSALTELADFYPKHIDKEDKHFFIPVMDYFTTAEKEKMLKDIEEFDRQFIHEKYRVIIEELEKKESG